MGNFNPISEFLFWQVVPRADSEFSLPCGIWTASPPKNMPQQMPPEAALLLPGPHCSSPWPDSNKMPAGSALGMFVANPVLNTVTLSRDLKAAGIEWIANIPSLAQHEADFRRDLSDVGIGTELEANVLTLLCDAGFRVMAVVGTADDAKRAVQTGASALLALPPVGSYETGFPSTRVRAGQIARIRSAFSALDLPVLGLLTKAEYPLQTTWPNGFDAGVVRPQRIS